MPAELDQHVDVQSYGAQAAGAQYEQQYDAHAAQQQGYEQQPPLDAQQYDPEQLAQLQEHAAAAAAAQQGQDPISALLAAGAAVGDPNAGDGDVDVEVSCITALRVSDDSGHWIQRQSVWGAMHASHNGLAKPCSFPLGLTSATSVAHRRAATRVATAM
jgi:hypothetical protein